MEKIILTLIVAVALYAVIRRLVRIWRPVSGSNSGGCGGGCSCSGNTSKPEFNIESPCRNGNDCNDIIKEKV